MKKTQLSVFALAMTVLTINQTFAQNIGINGTGATPNTSSMLDISASDKGLLIPRVSLTATNVASPITTPATSLLVYNTSTAGTTPNNVIPGYYYWDGAKWVRFQTGTSNHNTLNQAYNEGGAGLGRTITANSGAVTINGTTSVSGGQALSVTQSSTNAFGIGVTHSGTGPGIGVVSSGVSNIFAAIQAETNSSNLVNSAIVGLNNGSGYGIKGVANNTTGAGVFATSENTSGTGLIASGNNIAADYLTGGSGAFIQGSQAGTISLGKNSGTGWGIFAAGNGEGIWTPITDNGGGGSFTGYQYGVYGFARAPYYSPLTRASFKGDYNYDDGTYFNQTVLVGAVFGGTPYKIIGTAGSSVSTTMQTREGEKILFAPEAPENWFFDLGEVVLVNGKATVALDPLFVDCISDIKPFKVFVQGGENTLGTIRVSRNQDDKTFVLEDLGGESNGTVQYSVHGIWRNKENLRFPEFPAELRQKPVQMERNSMKKN